MLIKNKTALKRDISYTKEYPKAFDLISSCGEEIGPSEFFTTFNPCHLVRNHTIIGFSLPICWYSVLYIFGAVITDLVPGTGKL